MSHVCDLVLRYGAAFDDDAESLPFAPSWDAISTWTGEAAAPLRTLPYDEVVDRIEAAAPSLAAGASGDPHRPFTWMGGDVVPMGGGLGIVLNELLVHGWDLATGTGQAWVLDPQDISAGLGWALHALGPAMDPGKVAGHTATYELRLRDGDTSVLKVVDGRAAVGEPGVDRPDVVMSAPAATLLFTMYGRRPLWWTVTAGRALAWGRRPWLALTLPSRFRPF